MKEFAYIHEEGAPLQESIENTAFLKSFEPEHRDDLLASSCLLECETGDEIIADGEAETRIFILLAGSVEVIKGGKKVAEFSQVGEIFGEMAAIDDSARSASVKALEKTFCLAVDQKFLVDLMPREENPSFYAALYEAIARILASRLKAASADITRLEGKEGKA